MELSIIIVNYNTALLLEKCIFSILNFSSGLKFEIIVVDNDSQDDSKRIITEKFPQVVWLESGYNAGFSRANNIGIRNAKGDYVLLLNPDTEVKEDFLISLLAFYKQRDSKGDLGLLGCRIISLVDGSLLVGTGIGFPSIKKALKANPLIIRLQRVVKSVKTKKYNPKIMHYQNHEVDFVSGSCVMISKRKILEANLFLDEDFFLYSEDVEWSYRVKNSGFVNYFCGELEVYHINSASTDKLTSGKSFQILLSRFLFILKSYGVVYYLLYLFIVKANWWVSQIIDFKNKIFGRSNESIDLTIHRQNSIIEKHGFKIIRDYYFKPTSSQYLRYV
jgi:GT2 family glycosyltransferase